MNLFDPKYGYTELQLRLMRTNTRTARNALDEYDLELTQGEEDDLREQFDKMVKTLDDLIQMVEDKIEVSYLERKFAQ